MAWNEASERRFLLCTLDSLQKNPYWDLLSARMGPGELTASACRWNAETERAMLLVVCVELRPNPATWQVVADRLGGGLNANAVSQKFYKLKKEAAEIQKFETPKRDAPNGDRKSTGTGTKRKREKNVEASRETPSKPSKKQMTPLDLDALAADDDGETKPYSKGQLKMETDEDEEMEDEGRNAEEA